MTTFLMARTVPFMLLSHYSLQHSHYYIYIYMYMYIWDRECRGTLFVPALYTLESTLKINFILFHILAHCCTEWKSIAKLAWKPLQVCGTHASFASSAFNSNCARAVHLVCAGTLWLQMGVLYCFIILVLSVMTRPWHNLAQTMLAASNKFTTELYCILWSPF